MRILALETAVQPGSIALLENEQVLARTDLASGSRTTQTLVPAISVQLDQLGWNPGDLGLVAVSVGPGSFTGLRVGVTVAKTIAYAIGADVIGVDTLEIIARQAKSCQFSASSSEPSGQVLWAVMDAQRQELYCAKFERSEPGDWRPMAPLRVVAVDTWLEQVSAGDVVSGPPIEKLQARINPRAVFEVLANRMPMAATVGQLAAEAYQRGRRDNLWGLIPKYHRPSAAEEKLAARN